MIIQSFYKEDIMYKYISNQDEILSSILKDIKNETKLSLITGASGAGKSFLLNSIEQNTEQVIIYKLEGDYYSRFRDFYPFTNFINTMYIKNQTLVQKKLVKDGLTTVSKELGSWLPLGSEFLSACISELSETNKKKRALYNLIFGKDELDILFPLEYFCHEDSKIIFLIDDIQYWDKKSICFLYTLLRQKGAEHAFLNNALFIGAINLDFKDYADELEGIINLAQEHLYQLMQVDKRNYKIVMRQLGLSVELNDNLIDALYSITAGNLQLSTDIVLLLNNESDIEDTIRRIITDKNLGHLLIERLNKVSDRGNMINETLKYASLFGPSFYYHDLEQILDQDESYVRNLVETAQKFCLVNGSANSASFIHELIREAYKNETYENKVKYYTGHANCLKVLYPGNYEERAKSLKDAGQYEEASIVNILEFLKQLRTNNSCSSTLREEMELSYYLAEYTVSMENAYNYFFNDNYSYCLSELEAIEDILPDPLLAEKYYLMSITLSKWLDTYSRAEAVNCLIPYLDLTSVNNEIEIWERVISAYIVACVHNNDSTTALVYEHKLQASIKSRINFDMDASYKLNILRRKASSLYPPRQAYLFTKKSKDFFAPKESNGMPLNPIEYYMSLNNFLATSLMSGEFASVVKEATELVSLPKKIKYMKFPRFEMPLNNSILISFLNQRITAQEACIHLKQIIKDYNTEDSTGVIIKVNIAVLYGLVGDFTEAGKILTELYENTKDIKNLEFYYKFLIEVNLAAIRYLDDAVEEALKLLTPLQEACTSREETYLGEHVRLLIKDFEQEFPQSRDIWYQMYLVDQKLQQKQYWKYYGHKYLFGELEFWSES